MIPLTLADVAAATGGRLDGADPAATVTGAVVTDSRRAGAGALFVCLPGEQVDGHDYAPAAVAAGAVAVLAARPVAVPAVVVADPQEALGALARAVLSRLPGCRVVGVTGSSGKTSTKDLLARIFAAAGPTVAPVASLNNEIGLPLTVLRVDGGTQTLVAEYSARGVGHIRYLCGIARPTISVVLNVGTAHLGEFGSRAAVAAAKGELVEALPADGTAVLNADDDLVAAMAARTAARTLTFGTGPGADVRLADLRLDEAARPRFRLETPAGAVDVALALHGAHHATNAAAATAAALAAGLDLELIRGALEAAAPDSPHRMAVTRRADGVLVIDDAYNANPESTRAALDALAGLSGATRRWAVLGEMRELGAESADLHRAVGAHAAALGIDEIVAVGDAASVADGARAHPGWDGRARTVADVDAAIGAVAGVGAGDAVLVKASHSIALWRVADALLSVGPDAAGVPA